MKIRKLLIIPICIVTCLMMSGCNARNITRLMRIGYNLTEKEDKKDDISIEEDVSSLSDVDKKILSNLFESAISYTNSGVTDFVSLFIGQDDIFNFDKSQKADYGMEAVTPELAMGIVYDGLGIKSKKEDFQLNQYGNIDLISTDGDGIEFYINKIVKIGENEYSIYANSVMYVFEGARFNGCYEFNVIKNDESMFGYTVRGVQGCEVDEWIPEKITASSTLNNDENSSYDVNNLMDNDIGTVWSEGADGIGSGEYVLFESSEKQRISGAIIDNGYLKSTDLLNKNGSLKKVKFEFSDGSIIESNLSPVVTVDNYVDYLVYTDYIDFGKEIETTYVKMTILDASVGSDYENTCVSEIKFIKY